MREFSALSTLAIEPNAVNAIANEKVEIIIFCLKFFFISFPLACSRLAFAYADIFFLLVEEFAVLTANAFRRFGDGLVAIANLAVSEREPFALGGKSWLRVEVGVLRSGFPTEPLDVFAFVSVIYIESYAFDFDRFVQFAVFNVANQIVHRLFSLLRI